MSSSHLRDGFEETEEQLLLNHNPFRRFATEPPRRVAFTRGVEDGDPSVARGSGESGREPGTFNSSLGRGSPLLRSAAGASLARANSGTSVDSRRVRDHDHGIASASGAVASRAPEVRSVAVAESLPDLGMTSAAGALAVGDDSVMPRRAPGRMSGVGASSRGFVSPPRDPDALSEHDSAGAPSVGLLLDQLRTPSKREGFVPPREDGATDRFTIVTLNVGGQLFTTTKATLLSDPESNLAKIVDGRLRVPVDEGGHLFLDRDPIVFQLIVNALRDGTTDSILPDDRAILTRLWAEARFLGLRSLMEEVDAELGRISAKPIPRGLVLQLLHSSSDGRLQLPATKMSGLVLSFLRLADSTFTGCDFSRADLSGSDLSRCHATFASFVDANLASAILNEARLEQCDFRGASMVRANLTGADVRGANLRGSDLRRANLTSVSCKGAVWDGANLEKAIVISVDLRGAKMEGLVLREANLEGCDLEGACLRGSDLSRANLWGCNGLDMADLSGCNLTGAILPPSKTARGGSPSLPPRARPVAVASAGTRRWGRSFPQAPQSAVDQTDVAPGHSEGGRVNE
jgi:uncharacterized protein YjbI with pentapeptide repeats